MISSGEIGIHNNKETSAHVCNNIVSQLETLVRAENFDAILVLLRESCSSAESTIMLGQIGRQLFEEENYVLTINLLEFANAHFPTPIFFQYLGRSYQALGDACAADRYYAFFLEAQCRDNLTLANQADLDSRTMEPNFENCDDSYISSELREGISRVSRLCETSDNTPMPEMIWPSEPSLEAHQETTVQDPEEASANYPYGIQFSLTGLAGYNLGSLWSRSLITWHAGGEVALRFFLDDEPTNLRTGTLLHPLYLTAGMSATYLSLDDGASFVRYEGFIRSGLMLPIYQDVLYLFFETGAGLGVQEPINEADYPTITPHRIVSSAMGQLGLSWLLEITSGFSINMELSARYTRMSAVDHSKEGAAIHMLTCGFGLSLVWPEAYQRAEQEVEEQQ